MPVVVFKGLLRLSLGLPTSERAKENGKTAALKRINFSVSSGNVAIFSHCTVGVTLHQMRAEYMKSAYLVGRSSARWGSNLCGHTVFLLFASKQALV